MTYNTKIRWLSNIYYNLFVCNGICILFVVVCSHDDYTHIFCLLQYPLKMANKHKRKSRWEWDSGTVWRWSQWMWRQPDEVDEWDLNTFWEGEMTVCVCVCVCVGVANLSKCVYAPLILLLIGVTLEHRSSLDPIPTATKVMKMFSQPFLFFFFLAVKAPLFI